MSRLLLRSKSFPKIKCNTATLSFSCCTRQATNNSFSSSSSMVIRKSLSPIRQLLQQYQYRKRSISINHTRQPSFSTSVSNDSTITSARQHDDDTTALSLLKGLPVQYLRALNPANYNLLTGQRNNIRINKINGKPLDKPSSNDERYVMIDRCTYDNDGYYHVWFSDGVNASYPHKLINDSIRFWKGEDVPIKGIDEEHDSNNIINSIQKVHWNNIDENYIRQSSSLLNIPFQELINDIKYQSQALRSLYQYGIVLVTGTPIDDEGAGIAALAAAISGSSIKNSKTSLLPHYQKNRNESSDTTRIVLPNGTDGPMRTLYGMVWSTSIGGQPDGSSIADSAYTNDALPLHTDFTYYQTPPGLQIFTMNIVARDGGGQSVYGDGFAMAEQLRTIDPEAFRILSTTIRRYRSIDTTTGWHLQATGPVIQLEPYNKQIHSIRHNDLDRLPDLPPPEYDNINEFFEQLEYAHYRWNEIIADDTYRLVMSLQKGDTIIVANQRCMHGRTCFIPPRAVSGCYVSQDELDSRFRMEGYYC